MAQTMMPDPILPHPEERREAPRLEGRKAPMQPIQPCAIAVMAKAPRAGRVKTRLVPPLTAEAAGKLSAAGAIEICGALSSALKNVPETTTKSVMPSELKSAAKVGADA